MEDKHKFVKKKILDKNVDKSDKNIEKELIVKKEKNIDLSKKKIDKKKIEEDLFEIYGDKKNNSLDMKTIKKNKQGSFFKSFFIFVFALAFFLFIAWLGFFMNPAKNIFSEEEFKLTISGEEKIKIGETFSYRINYKNSQNIELRDVKLELRYPKGFVFVTSSVLANDEKNTVWELGTIKPFGSGHLDIEGKVFGDLNSEQSIRAFLNYIPENFNSEFQKVVHITLITEESPFNVEFKIPENVSKNSDNEFTLTISPQELEMKNLKIVCESDDFIFKSSNIESVNNSCEWLIENLDKEEVINFTGNFAEDTSSESFLKIKIFHIDEEKNEEFLIFEEERKIDIVRTDFVFNLAINGVMSESTIKPGENLNSTLVIKNSGDTSLEDLVVKIVLEAPSFNNQSLLSWPKLNVEPYDADVFGRQISETMREGTITWNKNYVTELAKVMPGEEIFIDFSLPLRTNSDLDLASFEDYEIKVFAELEYKKNDQKELKTSNEIKFRTVSDLELDIMNSISKNEENNEVYKITWLINNSFHELENINLGADIYGKVKIDQDKFKVSSGKIDFDENEKKIKWTIDSLPTRIPDAIIMQFEVEILEKNPSQESLVSSVNLSAKDKKTGDIIKIIGEEIKL